jgi:hypothetical protein
LVPQQDSAIRALVNCLHILHNKLQMESKKSV